MCFYFAPDCTFELNSRTCHAVEPLEPHRFASVYRARAVAAGLDSQKVSPQKVQEAEVETSSGISLSPGVFNIQHVMPIELVVGLYV
jgi:hypothetical protein